MIAQSIGNVSSGSATLMSPLLKCVALALMVRWEGGAVVFSTVLSLVTSISVNSFCIADDNRSRSSSWLSDLALLLWSRHSGHIVKHEFLCNRKFSQFDGQTLTGAADRYFRTHPGYRHAGMMLHGHDRLDDGIEIKVAEGKQIARALEGGAFDIFNEVCFFFPMQ